MVERNNILIQREAGRSRSTSAVRHNLKFRCRRQIEKSWSLNTKNNKITLRHSSSTKFSFIFFSRGIQLNFHFILKVWVFFSFFLLHTFSSSWVSIHRQNRTRHGTGLLYCLYLNNYPSNNIGKVFLIGNYL